MDKAQQIAFDDAAPAGERQAAMTELQAAHRPTLASQLLPDDSVRDVIAFITDNMAEQDMFAKAVPSKIIPFPSQNRGKRGMQSVQVDELQINVMGEYWERPSMLSFDSLRSIVEQTPILNAIVMTRVRQAQRFCRVNESGEGPGFTIRHIDKKHKITPEEQQSINLLQRFVLNSGWEFKPRLRKALRRDNMSTLIGKYVRDSLSMDSAAIETEMKRDRNLGIDGIYAVDGATIRLVTEQGYQGRDEIFALQVVQGRIRSAYSFEELIYEPRNPRTDVKVAGYGLAEPELLIRVVTGFLNAMTYNIDGFDKNSIPKGMLQLTGDYSTEDLQAFKRYWNGMVKGINNRWSLPVMISKDPQGKATFENFGVEYDEMAFSKWMTFLTSLACAIYGMSPAEINFDSFSGGNTSPLSGSDTGEKLAASKDSGLVPLMAHIESIYGDFIVSDFDEKYVMRFTGLEDEDAEAREERAKLVLTVNEMRAGDGYENMDGPLGDAPVNPSLIAPWQAIMQAQAPQDFGQPPGAPGAEGESPNEPQGDFGQVSAGNDDEAGDQAGGEQQAGVMAKAMPARGKATPAATNYACDIDDEIFVHGDDHAPTSARVVAIGKHGVTLHHATSDKRSTARWDQILGHKKRANLKMKMIEHGEDGMVVEDAHGRRRFIQTENYGPDQ